MTTKKETDDKLYSWDELYDAATDKPCGSLELKAKDAARWETRAFAMEQGFGDLELEECPEDCVEYYSDKFGLLFNERGYIVAHNLTQPPSNQQDVDGKEGVL